MQRVYLPLNVHPFFNFAREHLLGDSLTGQRVLHGYGLLSKIDIIDDGKNYVLVADLPGLTKENLSIEIEGKNVTLKVTSSSEESLPNKKFLHRERPSIDKKATTRTFTLPELLDSENTTAALLNGVLHVTLAKKDIAEKRVIPVS